MKFTGTGPRRVKSAGSGCPPQPLSRTLTTITDPDSLDDHTSLGRQLLSVHRKLLSKSEKKQTDPRQYPVVPWLFV
eukprot:3497769-Rhodomonas_salina.1